MRPPFSRVRRRVELDRLGRLRRDLLRRLWRLIEAEHPGNYREVCLLQARARVLGIERDRLAQELSRSAKVFLAKLPHHVVSAQDEVVSLDLLHLARPRLGALDDAVSAGDLADDLTDD